MANVDNIEAWEAGRLRNILYNARKTWRLSTPRHLEILDAVEVGRDYDNGRVSYRDNFMGSMAYALDKFGKLTPKQSEAVLKGIDARAAKRAEWASEKAAVDAKREHIGTVGEKSTITLTVKHIVTLEGVYGISYLHICEDADNNIIIYKGNASGFPRTGETATVVATIKDHGVREGVKQTMIQRPKLAK